MSQNGKYQSSSFKTNQNREDEMTDYDDNASDISLPDLSTRTFELENNVNTFGEQKREHERMRIERSFNEMNRQIGELTSLVRTLTDRFPRKIEKRMTVTPRKIDLRAILRAPEKTHMIISSRDVQ